MRTWKIIITTAVITIFFISVVAIVAAALGINTIARRDQMREDYVPPEVIVSSPPAGSEHPAGMVVEVSASALGYFPIGRVELWLDGVLMESRSSDTPEGITPFYVDFGLVIPEGTHNIVVRAINSKGVVGQSLPFNIFGVPANADEIPSIVISAEEGETVDDLAKKTGLEKDDILAADPAIAGGIPPGGKLVIVPVPEEKNKQQIKPNNPPQNQPAPKPPAGGTEMKVKDIPGFGFIVSPPPAAPSNLTMETDSCWIQLKWNDNATNETSYRVWRSSPGTMPTKVVELKSFPGTGLAKYQFAAPFAGIFNVWVEAVNLGGTQASNTLTVNTMTCGATDSDEYQMEVIGMHSILSPEKSYCYVSLDNHPDVRIPKDENSFIQLVQGELNISDWAAGSNKFVFNQTYDNILIAMECWGWQEGSLNHIGNIESTEIKKSDWVGNKITLFNNKENPTFSIDLTIKPLSSDSDSISSNPNAGQLSSILSSSAESAFNSDPSIPIPNNMRLERYGSADGNASDIEEYEYFWERTLKWDMQGDKSKVNGYAIYLNGNPYKIVEGASAGETQVKLPTTCGQKLSWRVAAYSGQGQSALSNPVEEILPPCNSYISVHFEAVTVECLSDGWGVCGNIAGQKLYDSAELYYYLSVGKFNSGKITQYFYWGDSNFHPALSVGRYEFKDLGNLYVKGGKYKSADTLVIPVSSNTVSFDVEVELWDYDSESDNDLLLHHKEGYDWDQEKLEYFRKNCGIYEQVRKMNDSADIWLFYTVDVFPNNCGSKP